MTTGPLENLLTITPDDARASARRRFREVHGSGAPRVVLWGAGALARLALAGCRKAGFEPLALCDRNPRLWHTALEGAEVLPPDEALARFRADAVFVPAVYTNHALLAELAGRGARTLPFAALAWAFPEAMLPHCALDLPTRIHEEADLVREGLGVWGDEASRREYLAQVHWRTTLDGSSLPLPLPPRDMFNPRDLMAFREEEHIVDCGAFDGDTIRNHLVHHPSGQGPLVAIEPDPLSFRRLEVYRDSLEPAVRDRICPVQAALGASPGVIPFRATGGVGSLADEGGACQVVRLRLDDVAEAQGATFLKMDIEGAEAEALEGARNLILRDRPVLGICLYHRPEDLWGIPLLIRSMVQDYKLFLRRYSDECWEQVCYAIPTERLRGHGIVN